MADHRPIIITRPTHDPCTRYLSCYSGEFIISAQKKGIKVVDLTHDKATRNEFEGRIKKLNPSLVVLNGHGDENTVTGHDNKTIVKAGENEEILKNRITYAVSCDSAKRLGQLCADNKTTYIGYDEKFILIMDRRCLNHPEKDKRAAQFLEASNQVPLSLIKGHTARTASIKSKDKFKETIRKLITAKHQDPDTLEDVKTLWWDMTHQVCLGNGDARI